MGYQFIGFALSVTTSAGIGFAYGLVFARRKSLRSNPRRPGKASIGRLREAVEIAPPPVKEQRTQGLAAKGRIAADVSPAKMFCSTRMYVDACSALENLGFGHDEARDAVARSNRPGIEFNALMRGALSLLKPEARVS